jgi:ferritin
MRSWVQSLMGMCLIVSCVNVVYKHIHHMVNIQTLYIMAKWFRKHFVDKIGKKKTLIFFIAMIIIQSMIPSSKKIKIKTIKNKRKQKN